MKFSVAKHSIPITSGSRNKISLKFKKCAISNKSIQMAELAGTENRKEKRKNKQKTPTPARERTPRHRSIPEIAVGAIPLGTRPS